MINIITKGPGTGTRPTGSVGGEVGERRAGAYEADLAGKADRVGYFLYAGQQESDGLLNNRIYDAGRAYGKLTVDLPHQGLLTFSGLAVDPHYKTGDFNYDVPYFSEDIRDRTHFITANYDTPLTGSLHLNLGGRDYERNFIDNSEILSASPEGDPGALLWRANWHERSQGANGLLTWQDSWPQVTPGLRSIVLGWTRSLITAPGPRTLTIGGARHRSSPGPLPRRCGGSLSTTPCTFGRFTLTPGLRYDQHSISGPMVSPSLGATYLLRPDTLLRATAAHGFQNPILSYIAGGGIMAQVDCQRLLFDATLEPMLQQDLKYRYG